MNRVQSITLALAWLVIPSCTANNSNGPNNSKAVTSKTSKSLGLVDEADTRGPEELFCVGFKNILKGTKQPIKDYYSDFCESDTSLTANFKGMQAAPFTGADDDIGFTSLKNDYTNATKLIEVKVVYVVEVEKKSVPLLLAEESFIQNTNYTESNGDEFGLGIKFHFIDPPTNDNDCDTAMRVTQTTAHNADDVVFSERSVHDLKLYRMHPNNFDYLMAARTLDSSVIDEESGMSPLFKNAIAIRGVMPATATSSYSMTLVHFVLDRTAIEDDRENVQEDLLTKVREFMIKDMNNLLNHHK